MNATNPTAAPTNIRIYGRLSRLIPVSIIVSLLFTISTDCDAASISPVPLSVIVSSYSSPESSLTT